MASGLPDFYRSVNIKQQDLSQLIVRPKYGGARRSSGSVIVDASLPTRLATIPGKGVLYGGTVWLDYTSSQAQSAVGMKLDGWVLASLSFVRMNNYAVYKPGSSIYTLNVYDVDNDIYSVGLSYGITFEEYLDLYYFEEHGNTPNVFFDIVYALI